MTKNHTALDKNVTSVFENDQIWINTKTNIECFIRGNEIKTYENLYDKLAKAINFDYQQKYISNQIRHLKDTFRDYLNGNRLKSPFENWVLKYPTEDMKSGQERMQENINQAILKNTSNLRKDIISQGNYTFYNIKYETEWFSIEPNQYKDFSEILVKCIKKIININKSIASKFDNLDNLSSQDKNKLSAGFSEMSNQNGYLGWKFKKNDNFDPSIDIPDLKRQIYDLPYIVQSEQFLTPVNFQSSINPSFNLTLKELAYPMTLVFESNYINKHDQNAWLQFLDYEFSSSFSDKIILDNNNHTFQKLNLEKKADFSFRPVFD